MLPHGFTRVESSRLSYGDALIALLLLRDSKDRQSSV
jgi:hypothetical protein